MTKQQLKKNIFPSKIDSDSFEEFTLNQNDDWVRELLIELNEKAVDQTPEAYLDQTNLDLKIKLKRCHEHSIGSALLVDIEVSSHFATSCALSLQEIFDDVSFTVNACFIPEDLKDLPEYKEQTELFIAGSLRELYFLEDEQANLAELIHEHVFLNIDAYPKFADAESNELFPDTEKLKN